jgi:hypothetical protein
MSLFVVNPGLVSLSFLLPLLPFSFRSPFVGRSPDFRIRQVRFAKSRIRLAWVSPGYGTSVWTQFFIMNR